MKFEEFKEEVMLTLGDGMVDVELSERDVYVCFKKAKRIFQQQGHDDYRCVYLSVDIKPGQTYIYLDDVIQKILDDRANNGVDDQPMITDTSKVMFVSRALPLFTRGGNYAESGTWDHMIYNMTNNADGGGGRVGYGYMGDGLLMSALRNTIEAAYDNQRNRELMCEYDPFSNMVSIVSNQSVRGVHLLECWLELEEEDYFDIDWIIRWTIAEAKIMLGTAYRKFQTLPGPTGQTSLNGDSYISDARTEKEALMEEILNYVDGDIDYGAISSY